MSSTNGRIESLDSLRGFALLGILVVNIQVFSGWGFIGEEGKSLLSWSLYDPQIKIGLNVFAHGKFYPLFSLLFGYSFVLAGSKHGSKYHLKRMFGLALFGLAHSVFLWPWDILLFYALVGVFLTPFLHRQPGTLLAWAIGLLVVMMAGRLYWLTYDPFGAWSGRISEIIGESIAPTRDGSYWEVVAANLKMMQAVAMSRLQELRPLEVMALFLLGAAAARLQLARPSRSGKRLLFGWAIVGLPLALGLAFTEKFMTPEGTFGRLTFVLAESGAGPIFALTYAAILILWWTKDGPVAHATRAAMAPAGRMALTNYLAQSIICVPVFYGFGMGLFTQHSLFKLMLFSLVLFLVQLLISYFWLRFFRQGPLEWLWRWQIQGSRPRFRR